MSDIKASYQKKQRKQSKRKPGEPTATSKRQKTTRRSSTRCRRSVTPRPLSSRVDGAILYTVTCIMRCSPGAGAKPTRFPARVVALNHLRQAYPPWRRPWRRPWPSSTAADATGVPDLALQQPAAGGKAPTMVGAAAAGDNLIQSVNGGAAFGQDCLRSISLQVACGTKRTGTARIGDTDTAEPRTS